MRRPVLAAAVVALTLVPVAPASADDGWGFRLTSPRGDLVDDGDEFLLAIPAGRAWGITSGLRLLPDPGTVVSVEIDVRDPAVREAFLRIAYYERASGRPRQVQVADSVAVPFGERELVQLAIQPPPGAVAFRLRVLGRLAGDEGRSASGGIVAGDLVVAGGRGPGEVRRTRLVMGP